MNTTATYERYQRQITLKEFGIATQEKLLHSKVLVAGAGGLGCPALQYLAAAGVGTIGIVDDDVVALSNLHRQVLYSMEDIGFSKVMVAADKLKQLNNEINIIPYNFRLTNQNALDIIAEYDLILDGTDNFSSRYMINDACVLLNKPFVYGAILSFEGQVALFNGNHTNNKRAVHYRDLFPHPPKNNEVMNCAEAGVLGVLPGVIGTMQANEAIKFITGIGKTLTGKLITWNALDNSFYELYLSVNEAAQALIPKNRDAFLKMDYEWLCASAETGLEINADAFNDLIHESNTIIIDVREQGEQPFVDEFKHLQIPLSAIQSNKTLINGDTIVLFCQSGKRSLQAARILNELFHHSKKIYSLKDGIVEWKRKYVLPQTENK